METGDEAHARAAGDPSVPAVRPLLLAHAFDLARECGAGAIFVYYDALPEGFQPDADLRDRIHYITRSRKQSEEQAGHGHRFVQVPDIALSRMGQIKMAVLLSLAKRTLRGGERIVCLSGAGEARTLDTIVVLDVGKEFELVISPENQLSTDDVMPAVLEKVIGIAADLSTEGREGKGVGALFVIGDTERVVSMSRQLILNPFQGYPEDQRNILDPNLEETVKELSTIDGAFLIRADGVVESAGTYLKTGSAGEHKLRPGLGARHQAAAAITAVSRAIAITVSQSTGTVTVFRNGQIVTEIERPTSARPA